MGYRFVRLSYNLAITKSFSCCFDAKLCFGKRQGIIRYDLGNAPVPTNTFNRAIIIK